MSILLSLLCYYVVLFTVFFFKQKTAYEMRISDWSSDVCSSDLKGDRLKFSPEYTIGGSADYSFDIGQYNGTFSVSGNYTSRRSLHTIARGPVVTTGDHLFIARTTFTVEAPQGWSATLFVDNIGNVNKSVSGPNFGVPQWDLRTTPRTIGLQIEKKF